MVDRVRVTQVGAETLFQSLGEVRVTQVGVETLFQSLGEIRVSQLGVEIMTAEGVGPSVVVYKPILVISM